MKKKILGIFVCMLLIAVSISSVTGTIDENESLNMKTDGYNNLIKQAIESGVISNNDWLEQDKLLASDGEESDWFGWHVSISGDYALIGAHWADGNGACSGSAYVFIRSGTSWSEQAKLLASDGAGGDCFGSSVSIDGDYAIIGARQDDDTGEDFGSAYVFMRSGTSWSEQAKLLASDGATEDFFGMDVSINGDYALIGAHWDDDNGNESGSAYVFMRSGTSWSEQAKLLPSDGASGDCFGSSVSIDGDYALIGAHSGSAYIFKRSGTSWSEQAKLLPSDGASGDCFGKSVSISGDYAIIGAIWDDDNGDDSGSAYVFKRDGTIWTEEQKLLASDGAYRDNFGNSVSISGDYALIGAHRDDDNGNESGSAYIFKRSGTSWSEQAKLLPSDGASGDCFGKSVSIDGDYALIGAHWDDDNGEHSGSAYLFRKLDPNAPEAPTITGETDGKAGVEYEYTFNAEDPNGDDVKYFIVWGDDNTEWTGFSASGTPVIVSHTWVEEDTYTIAAKAQDEYGAESDWATLEVEMPVNQQVVINPLLQMILERFPYAFPILRYLLGL